MVNDYSIALDNIKQLQLRGFKISIEKFGSGLASFAYLQSIPTNELKIDKSFSDRFAEPKTHAILSNIIQLAKRLEIRLVVEGLETQQQVKVFADLDVDRIQGWAISKPLTLEALLNDITIRKLERSLVNSADISTLYDGQEIQKTTQRICSDPH
jgi:sensor c-di-GMP phosphodiesterase-like protein